MIPLYHTPSKKQTFGRWRGGFEAHFSGKTSGVR